jgi:hypothetical protein
MRSVTSGAKAHPEEKRHITALEALRHPKAGSDICGFSATYCAVIP